MNSIPKVLILQGEISSYRWPIFNIIAEQYDLTVGYYSKDNSNGQQCKFAKKYLKPTHCGPFIYIRGLRRYCNQFDAVIFMDDLHALSYCILPFGFRKYKILSWGFGLRASYTRLYDVSRKHTFLDRISQLINQSCDAVIFYMEKAKEFWHGTSFNLNKVFVAPNTTIVKQVDFLPSLKKNILFVGTLYEKKGIRVLLQAYKYAHDQLGEIPPLHIVGDGDDAENLKQFVIDHGLSDLVVFHGAIYDENVLSMHFQHALLCVSPHQAGLSVAKSMGYGVPFVTRRSAITGGELYHINDGENGILYDNDAELQDLIIDAVNNPIKYIDMGKKAKLYYEQNASPKHMADGAIDAIKFALKRDPS